MNESAPAAAEQHNLSFFRRHLKAELATFAGIAVAALSTFGGVELAGSSKASASDGHEAKAALNIDCNDVSEGTLPQNLNLGNFLPEAPNNEIAGADGAANIVAGWFTHGPLAGSNTYGPTEAVLDSVVSHWALQGNITSNTNDYHQQFTDEMGRLENGLTSKTELIKLCQDNAAVLPAVEHYDPNAIHTGDNTITVTAVENSDGIYDMKLVPSTAKNTEAGIVFSPSAGQSFNGFPKVVVLADGTLEIVGVRLTPQPVKGKEQHQKGQAGSGNGNNRKSHNNKGGGTAGN